MLPYTDNQEFSPILFSYQRVILLVCHDSEVAENVITRTDLVTELENKELNNSYQINELSFFLYFQETNSS